MNTKAVALILGCGVSFLGGCAVGPHYERPIASTPESFKESSPDAWRNALAGTWQPARPEDGALKGKWWEIFNEPELNALEETLDIDNQNIAQYFQNFMAARAQVREARAGYFPTVTVNPSATRSKTPAGASTLVSTGTAISNGTTGTGATGTTGTGTTGSGATVSTAAASSGTTSNLFSLPAEVSWEPDLWGKIRNTVREYQAAAAVSAADLENERLTEQAALAEYYFELRGQDTLQDLYRRTVDADRKSLELTRALYETGIDTDEDVAQAEVTLLNAEANASGVGTNRALYEHAIATLIGKPASTFSMPVKFLAAAPPPIPLGLPSQLLQRRPDVAAAERSMAEANALIGVEEAAYYPTLDLTASGGLESTLISSLFTAPARFWSLGASAAETVFDGGLRQATVAQYRASYKAAVASYRQTVLTAFQQSEDYIATLRITSEQLERQRRAVAAASRYLDIATARYETGVDPYLDVMVAETTLLGDQQTELTLRVNEMVAAVELVQALGGGWDASQLPTGSKVSDAQ
jgi:NodT family efflux transporter outer membrane factor (OMF) lipoprotein